MAKYKQECIFGIRAVIEAIQQEKEIDKVMLKQGVRGELFQQLFSLIRERNIPFQYVPEDVFKPFADRNHQGVLAEISPVPYQDLTEVLDGVEAAGRVPFVLILDRVTDVRNFGAIVRSAECAGVDVVIIPNKNSAKISSDALKTSAGVPGIEFKESGPRIEIPTGHSGICCYRESRKVLYWCRPDFAYSNYYGIGR